MNYEFDSMDQPTKRSKLLLWATLGGITGLVITLLVLLLLTQGRDDPDGDETAVAVESDEGEESDEERELKKQRERAAKAVEDSETAAKMAKMVAVNAEKEIKGIPTVMREDTAAKPFIQQAEKALAETVKASESAEVAKNEATGKEETADSAKDLQTAETAANAAVKAKEDAVKAQKDAETALANVTQSILKAKKAFDEAKTEADEAQANADVTLLPFKGDENLPVKIVFVEKPDVVSGTNIFAWSDDGKKYDWMKPGKESEPLATRKEEVKPAGFELFSVTYKIKKTGKPVKIAAGSFTKLSFETKLTTPLYEEYKSTFEAFISCYEAIDSASKRARIDFLGGMTNKPTGVKIIYEKLNQFKNNEETYLKEYPIVFAENPVLLPDSSIIDATSKNIQLAIRQLDGLLNHLKEQGLKKARQEDARKNIAMMLRKEVRKIRWTGGKPLYLASSLLSSHLRDSEVARRCRIQPFSISVTGNTIEGLQVNSSRLKQISSKTSTSPSSSKGSNEYQRASSSRSSYMENMLDEFLEYSHKEIKRFHEADLELACNRDVVLGLVSEEKLEEMHDDLNDILQRIKALGKAIQKLHEAEPSPTWELKDGKTTLIQITE
jgi:hypothetical protein